MAREALTDRLEGLPPACALGGMGTNELARAMIGRNEFIGSQLWRRDRLSHVNLIGLWPVSGWLPMGKRCSVEFYMISVATMYTAVRCH